MTAPFRPQPRHWSEFAQTDEPYVKPMRGWRLLLVWACALGFSLAVWAGILSAIKSLAQGG